MEPLHVDDKFIAAAQSKMDRLEEDGGSASRLIQKPPGQAGREKDGYSLSSALGLTDSEEDKAIYNAIRVSKPFNEDHLMSSLINVIFTVCYKSIGVNVSEPREDIFGAEQR